MRRSIQVPSILLLTLLLGCPGSGDDDTTGDDDAADDDATGDDDAADDDTAGDDDTALVPVAPCAFTDLSAADIHVSETYLNDGYGNWAWSSAVDAWVWSRPWAKVHGMGAFQHVAVEQGECRYLTLDPGGCPEPCGPGEMCAADGTCQPVWADTLSAGDLTITGLGDPVILEADGSGYVTGLYHTHATPPDWFAAFDTVTASFSGDEFPAATVSARGVAPLDTDLAGVFLPLLDGEDHEVTWTPGPDPDACVSLMINGHNAAHGLPLGDILWCVGPDDGSLTIPHEVFAPFPHGEYLGTFGGASCEGFDCAPTELSRYTRNQIEAAPGPVELIVRSTIQMGWSHID